MFPLFVENQIKYIISGSSAQSSHEGKKGEEEVSESVFSLILFCLQMKKWESWEGETRTLEYEFSNGTLL